jgi:hypothetical protein
MTRLAALPVPACQDDLGGLDCATSQTSGMYGLESVGDLSDIAPQYAFRYTSRSFGRWCYSSVRLCDHLDLITQMSLV